MTLTDGLELTCDSTTAAPGDEVACSGTHEVTQDDLDAGHWDSAGAASAASETPIAFDTNGTVRLPRGFTSST